MIALSQQQVEVGRARRFINDFGPVTASVRSLSEFVGETSQPSKPNELDNMMPDVVAQMGDREVGIELTAYSDDGIKNAWGSFVAKVRNAIRNQSHSYPSLKGLLLGYHPNTKQGPPGKVDEFARQLLELTVEMLPPGISECREVRSYALPKHARTARPYHKWPLLDGYVMSIRVTVPGRPLGVPVDVCTGFASVFGTRLEALTKTIDDKASKKRKQCYQNGIHEHWLLIHADREPKSSAIAPLDDYEIERILQSTAATSAKMSGFEKVILWDYVWGGYVDLVSGDYVTGQQT